MNHRKQSKSIIKKPIRARVVEKLIEKCNILGSELKHYRCISDELGISRKNITEFLLDFESFERKRINHKYNQHILDFEKFQRKRINYKYSENM